MDLRNWVDWLESHQMWTENIIRSRQKITVLKLITTEWFTVTTTAHHYHLHTCTGKTSQPKKYTSVSCLCHFWGLFCHLELLRSSFIWCITLHTQTRTYKHYQAETPKTTITSSIHSSAPPVIQCIKLDGSNLHHNNIQKRLGGNTLTIQQYRY